MSTPTSLALPTFGRPSVPRKRRAKTNQSTATSSKRDLTGALGEADDVSEDELEAGGDEGRREIEGDDQHHDDDDDDDEDLGMGLTVRIKGIEVEEREMMKRNRKRKGEQLYVVSLLSSLALASMALIPESMLTG